MNTDNSSKLPIPPNEEGRLKSLYSYQLLDSPPEEQFDRLTKLAASICGVPIALMSLIDKDRQWFKSKVGMDSIETARDISFCQYAILDKNLFEIEDAHRDERFIENPLVTGDPNIRFYAGYPLVMADGNAIGTLCVIDRIPRKLDDNQKESIRLLAEELVHNIKTRKEQEELKILQNITKTQKNEIEMFFNTTLELLCIADLQGKFVRVNKAWEEFLGIPVNQLFGEDFLQFIHPDDIDETLKAVFYLDKGKKIINFQNRYRNKEGIYCNLEWRSIAIDGLIYASARDITSEEISKKYIEEKNKELENSQNLLKQKNIELEKITILFNDAQRIAKLGAWDLDLESGKTFWTDEVYSIHEVDKSYDHDKVNGLDFYHPDDRPII
ncbi:MAG: PAS domain-containing protein, partial [Leptospira sp.]|nr:PAS domain-containing protein [Leptospira sp.]